MGRGSALLSARLTGKLSLGKDAIPSEIGGLHHAAQSFSKIWRKPMPIVQFVLGHNEFAIGIEHDEVCIVARRNPALARVTAC